METDILPSIEEEPEELSLDSAIEQTGKEQILPTPKELGIDMTGRMS